MHDFNRAYYKRIIVLRCYYRWKLVKMWLVAKLLKLAFRVDHNTFNTIVCKYAEPKIIENWEARL